MKRKELFIFLGIIFLVVAIIFLINYVKSNGSPQENTIKCIAEKADLFVSKTCSACASQKQILGENINYFNIIDCTTNRESCITNNIIKVPTWIINEEKYPGIKTITQLKELTGC